MIDNSKDTDFVKCLYANLMRGSKCIYTLKRAFGHPFKSDLKEYMSFLSVCEKSIDPRDEKVYFLVATMFYNFERHSTEISENTKYVKFEQLLSRIYRTSNSTNKTISQMIDSDFDTDGIFINRFVRIANRCKKELRPYEHLDFIKLISDFRFWNADNKRVKFQWAKEIVNVNKNEDESL